jgi:hypothetical protein
VSRAFGKGRLVLVASAQPLRNATLDQDDAAPLVVDLALAFGKPRIDEREHGLLPRPSPLVFLAGSTAAPSFLGILVVGFVLVWRGRSTPPFVLEPDQPAPPTLDDYVSSVANLYRRTRDHAEVLRSYQEFALSQLRRSLRIAPDAPRGLLERRLRQIGELSDDDLGLLFGEPVCRNRSQLMDATSRIDALLQRTAR